ncbi:MAG: restriction endonuclease subunit S, partial [Prevotella sp.]|nr:restriction endonuclease subunit S [Prevotella sp.]
MKEGWEYKKLGEVADIVCGHDYKSVIAPNGQYPIYGTGGIMGYATQYRCPSNSVVIGRKGNINKPL